ncbi:hypothetical protein PILCRDRAFT_732 [Piloderma croceum F 1598]|uniref:Uncharacterized protein n=1 Tax=Piloderma croceum (strain F 1598) TaxID=765440 RepID=A0A0C3GIW5_PILCF|nr:hypothetical protein PILCRDRAFT_732 [Piloderma croceum F 1598]
MAASQHGVSDAKQEAQRLLNKLGVANAVEADKAAAFEMVTAQVKSIDRSQKSVRNLSTNATWTLHKWEKVGYPLGLEEARVKTQKALLVMKLADAEKVLQLVEKQVDNFNLANVNYAIATSAICTPKRPLAHIECEGDENDDEEDNGDSGRMDGDLLSTVEIQRRLECKLVMSPLSH